MCVSDVSSTLGTIGGFVGLGGSSSGGQQQPQQQQAPQQEAPSFAARVAEWSPVITGVATAGRSIASFMGKNDEAAFANARATAEYNRQVAERQQVIEYNAAQRVNEGTSRGLTINSLNSRILQEQDAQAERQDQRGIERRQAEGKINAAAASTGVAGNTVAALMTEQFQGFSRQATDDAANTAGAVAQVRRNIASADASYQSRLNALRDPIAPQAPILRSGGSPIELLFGFGSAAADYFTERRRLLPWNSDGTVPSSSPTQDAEGRAPTDRDW